MNIVYYTAPNGVYFKIESTSGFWFNSIDHFKFNGISAKSTWSKDWYFLENLLDINEVTRLVSVSGKFLKWVLKDDTLASDKIPSDLLPEQVNADEDDEWANYSHLRSLYQGEYSASYKTEEKVDFNLKHLGKLDFDVESPVADKISVMSVDNGISYSKPIFGNIRDLTTWDEVTKMLVPDLLLHNYPCAISSDVMYRIIRAYVKNHIDIKQATITSDYDFCFTVKKKVAIKPISTQVEEKTAKGKSYSSPRFKTKVTTFKDVEIFEMTSLSKKYNNYTIVDGIQANNLKDLRENLVEYLESLITYINTPWRECEYCGGTGHVVENNWKLNSLS